jgi:hypothetical protein
MGEWPSPYSIIQSLPPYFRESASTYTFEGLAEVILRDYEDIRILNEDNRNIRSIEQAKLNFKHILEQLARAGLVPNLDSGEANDRLERVTICRKSRFDANAKQGKLGSYEAASHVIKLFQANPYMDRVLLPHEFFHASLEGVSKYDSYESPLGIRSDILREAVIEHLADRSTSSFLRRNDDPNPEIVDQEDSAEYFIPWMPDSKRRVNRVAKYIFLEPYRQYFDDDVSYVGERDLMYALVRLTGKGAGMIDFIAALIDCKGDRAEALDTNLTEALSGALPLGLNQTVLSWIKDNTEGPRSDELTEGSPENEKVERVLRIVREATGTADSSRLASWRERKRVSKNLRADISELRTA